MFSQKNCNCESSGVDSLLYCSNPYTPTFRNRPPLLCPYPTLSHPCPFGLRAVLIHCRVSKGWFALSLLPPGTACSPSATQNLQRQPAGFASLMGGLQLRWISVPQSKSSAICFTLAPSPWPVFPHEGFIASSSHGGDCSEVESSEFTAN